jgi:hypothetical protein
MINFSDPLVILGVIPSIVFLGIILHHIYWRWSLMKEGKCITNVIVDMDGYMDSRSESRLKMG